MTITARARDWGLGIVRSLGFNVMRTSNSFSAKRAAVLSRYEISLVLDVGANIGDYGRLVRSSGYAGQIISFEPTAAAFASLQAESAGDKFWEVRNIAIGDADGTGVIHVADSSVCSSLLSVTKASVDAARGSAQVGTETVTVRRLDSEIRVSTPSALYLKLDIQGFELAALRGAVGVLDQIVAIECEVSLAQLYEEQALIGEMLAEMDLLGYTPIWIERGFTDPHSGYMLQADVLCLRTRRREHSVVAT